MGFIMWLGKGYESLAPFENMVNVDTAPNRSR